MAARRTEFRTAFRTQEQFSVLDLEAVRLLLRGESVIDWHRLDFPTLDVAEEFLAAQEFDAEDPSDRARIEYVKGEAIAFLKRSVEFPIPKPVAAASAEELLLMASGRGHRQLCACTILKVMHIIHHIEGRELLFVLPLSDAEVFHFVEEKIHRVIGSMLADGFPIVEFMGGRKHKDSLYTKLLSKEDTIAAQIYDKLRFRIVTRTEGDVLPILSYLSRRLFPFNYVIPGQSTNSMFRLREYCDAHPTLRPLVPRLQHDLTHDETGAATDNRFSARDYRAVHFVVDLPVRLPRSILDQAPPAAWPLGAVIFVLCEFQILDRETEAANEMGDASHARYKERQQRAGMQRLKLGLRAPSPARARRKGDDGDDDEN